jgi:hypothetical protein
MMKNPPSKSPRLQLFSFQVQGFNCSHFNYFNLFSDSIDTDIERERERESKVFIYLPRTSVHGVDPMLSFQHLYQQTIYGSSVHHLSHHSVDRRCWIKDQEKIHNNTHHSWQIDYHGNCFMEGPAKKNFRRLMVPRNCLNLQAEGK